MGLSQRKHHDSSVPNIAYIGADRNYCKTIERVSGKNYPKLQVRYHFFNPLDSGGYLDLFDKLLSLNPVVIYLDFSAAEQVMEKISILLSKNFFFRKAIKVGLVNEKKMAKEINRHPFHFVHCKGGEYHDVIYDAYRLAIPSGVGQPLFAKAKLRLTCDLYEDFKVNCFSSRGLQIEGWSDLKEGEVFDFDIWALQKIFSSKKIPLKNLKKQQRNKWRHYFYDFEFHSLAQEEGGEGPKEDEGLKALEEWIEENYKKTNLRELKIFIVDYKKSLLKSSEDFFDGLHCDYYYQCGLSENMEEIFFIRPSLIFLHLWDHEYLKDFVEDSPNRPQYEAIEQLYLDQLKEVETLMKLIQEDRDYRPIIILFNSQEEVEFWKEKTSYPSMMARQEDMGPEVLQGLLEVFCRKIPWEKKEKRLYPHPTGPWSVATISRPITILEMTESDLLFSSDQEFSMGQKFRLKTPVNMLITIASGQGGELIRGPEGRFHYRAFISGVNEIEKRNLRKFVNQIIFSPKMMGGRERPRRP